MIAYLGYCTKFADSVPRLKPFRMQISPKFAKRGLVWSDRMAQHACEYVGGPTLTMVITTREQRKQLLRNCP